jgi:hypothetical protein
MDHSIYPPIERFQTIDGVVRSHAAEQEQKSAICYPVSAAADYEEHTPAEVDRYVDITAQHYIDQGLPPAVSAETFLSSAIPLWSKHQLLHYWQAQVSKPFLRFSL